MTLESLLAALYAWREARQKRIDGFLRAENPLRTLQREQESLNVLAAAVDAYRAEHPGGTDPLCECPACRLGTGRGLAEHDARREPDGKE